MPSKYHAVPTEIDGIRFDSKAEAARFQELMLLVNAEQIFELSAHPRFTVWHNGKDKIVYEADFSYFEEYLPEGSQVTSMRKVVEDVKGVLTPVYKLKRKMFLAMYPEIKFVEITK